MASTLENTNTKTDTTKEDSSKILADGLLQLLQPVVIECDTRMNQVFKSQHLLADQIDELAKGKRYQFPSKPLELEHFMVVAQKNPPPNLLPAIQTLVKARTRVNTLNNTLNTIKERLDRMEKIANSDASTALPLPDMFSSLLGTKSIILYFNHF
jgi:hypothetical protein